MNTPRILNAFHWNTGEPSIFWTDEGERAARRQLKNPGKPVDIQGNQLPGPDALPRVPLTIAKPRQGGGI